jgi:hypothetical protein
MVVASEKVKSYIEYVGSNKKEEEFPCNIPG